MIHGQGVVGVSLYLTDGSDRLDWYSHASMLLAAGLFALFVLFVRRLGPAATVLPWCAFFLATRSQDGYYVMMTPLWLAAAVTAPASEFATAWQPRPGGLSRRWERIAAAVLLITPALASAAWAATGTPPLHLRVVSVRWAAPTAVSRLGVEVTDTEADALAPHFTLTTGQGMNQYWAVVRGPATLPAHATARDELRPPSGRFVLPRPRVRIRLRDGTVMCPSYQVTLEEEHSTRGRARLLFEMLDGHGDSAIRDGWRSRAVKEALDLCLACKGCKSDCPADVDMATYKAEFLSHHYAGRPWRRPRSDLSMGWLPVAAQAVGRSGLGPVVNAFTHTPLLSRAAVAVAGIEDREMPLFARQSLQTWFARRDGSAAGERGTVLLWPDTFTNFFHPHVGQAAAELLEQAGWRVTMPTEPLCCGLTWISTGQLGVAERVLTRTVRHLAGHLRDGGLVVGLEPSCTAVFRSDAGELFPGDRDVRRLAEQTVTLSELLTEHTPGYEPPQVPGRTAHALAQVLPQRGDPQPPARRTGLGGRREAAARRRGRRRATGFRLLRPRRQLRLRTRPPGGQPRLRGTRPAAAAAGGGRRHGGPRGRLQLPYPDPRVRQRRPRGRPSGGAAGVGAAARVRRAGQCLRGGSGRPADTSGPRGAGPGARLGGGGGGRGGRGGGPEDSRVARLIGDRGLEGIGAERG